MDLAATSTSVASMMEHALPAVLTQAVATPAAVQIITTKPAMGKIDKVDIEL